MEKFYILFTVLRYISANYAHRQWPGYAVTGCALSPLLVARPHI